MGSWKKSQMYQIKLVRKAHLCVFLSALKVLNFCMKRQKERKVTCYEEKSGVGPDPLHLSRTLWKQDRWDVQCCILEVERKVNNNHLHGIDSGRSCSVSLRSARSERKELSLSFLFGDTDKWNVFNSMNHKVQGWELHLAACFPRSPWSCCEWWAWFLWSWGSWCHFQTWPRFGEVLGRS